MGSWSEGEFWLTEPAPNDAFVWGCYRDRESALAAARGFANENRANHLFDLTEWRIDQTAPLSRTRLMMPAGAPL